MARCHGAQRPCPEQSEEPRMSEPERFCSAGGYIVGMRAWLPADPSEAGFEVPTPAIGCTALRCARCGETVKNWAGFAAKHAGTLVALELYLHEGAGPPAELQPDPAKRVYACRCRWTQTDAYQALDIAVPPGAHLFQSEWRCAGHAGPLPRDLASAVDVTTMAALEARIPALLATRTAERAGNGDLLASPCLDVWRLERHLPLELSCGVRAIVRRALESPSPMVLQAALFYLKHRAMPQDGRDWLARLRSDPSVGDLRSPDFPGRSLRCEGAWLLDVLCEHSADDDHVVDPGLLTAYFDYFEEQGLDFRLEPLARLAYGSVLRVLLERDLAIKPHSARALERAWKDLTKEARSSALRAWSEAPRHEARRQVVLANLPPEFVRLAAELAT